MESIKNWVKKEFDGVKEKDLNAEFVQDYINYLFNDQFDYFQDLYVYSNITQATKIIVLGNVVLSLVLDKRAAGYDSAREAAQQVFKNDLIKRMDEIREDEESELDDNGIDNSDRLMECDR
jgi:hypothetical protein